MIPPDTTPSLNIAHKIAGSGEILLISSLPLIVRYSYRCADGYINKVVSGLDILVHTARR